MEPVATVGIIAKPDVRQTDELLPALLDWLGARSVGVRLDRDAAQSIVQDQAPVIPVDYGAGYALVARGLLGAMPNSEGLVRYAGMAWAG